MNISNDRKTMKEYRAQYGLSQKQFAEKFSIGVGTLRSWEQGVNRCPEYVLCMVGKLLQYEKTYGPLDDFDKKIEEDRRQDYARRVEKRKQTFLEKYGVENAMQVPEFKQSHQKSVRNRQSDPVKNFDTEAAAEFHPYMEPPKELTGTYRNLFSWAKYYQFPVFYARELKLWNENPDYRGMPLQSYLYLNRKKYLGKSPDQLSDLELMRSFTIAGVLKGYTAFDVSLMDQAVQEFHISSVYDPCAGWGERMLYCYSHGISYHGVDINKSLAPGYERMKLDFGMVEQSATFGDSAEVPLTGSADAVITCPPYGNQEIYSMSGAENFPEKDFLDWWKKVVENSKALSPKYFCFQINQKWLAPMSQVVEQCGFHLVRQLDARRKSSHMTRRNGKNQKREFESMLVFEAEIC